MNTFSVPSLISFSSLILKLIFKTLTSTPKDLQVSWERIKKIKKLIQLILINYSKIGYVLAIEWMEMYLVIVDVITLIWPVLDHSERIFYIINLLYHMIPFHSV